MQEWSSDLKWNLSSHAASQLGEDDLLRGVTAAEAAMKNKRGWSPAMYASAAGHRQTLVLLLSDPHCYRGDVEDDARNEAREQAMMTAVQYDNFEIVAFLVEEGLVALSAPSTLDDEFYNTACLMQFPTTDTNDVDRNTSRHLTFDNTGELTNFIKLREFFAACVSHPCWDPPSGSAVICSNLLDEQANRLVSRELQLFCRSLVVRINNYCPNEALYHFLNSLELSELTSNFLREEVDFTILIGMSDLDLLQIGINSPDAREKILEAKANIIVYFKQLFGSKITSFKRLTL